ncbi:MAG: hypothetical protein U1F57_05990 [bacterium]
MPEITAPSRTFKITDGLPVLAMLFGFAWVVLTYYPGVMSIDPLWQLEQARTGSYNEWHPPLMAFLWSFLDRIVSGPAGILLFHNLLFWVGLYVLVVCTVKSRPLSALFILGIGLFPPIFALLGTVWKDVGMGVSLVFAAAMLTAATVSRRNLPLWLALPALFYAFAVRHNSLFAVAPLLFWMASLLYNKGRGGGFHPKVFAVLCTAFMLLIFYGTNRGINRIALKATPAFPLQMVLIQDFIDLSLEKNQMLLPGLLQRQDAPLSFEEMKQTPPSLVFKRLNLVYDAERFSKLKSEWTGEMLKNLGFYLNNRWNRYAAELSLSGNVCFPFRNVSNGSWINDKALDVLNSLRNSLFFRAWVYLLLSILLFLYGWRAQNLPIFSLTLSGILYGAHYFLVAPACEFRYLWWSVLSVLISLPFFFESFTAKKSEENFSSSA